jgi:hypothetical protein
MALRRDVRVDENLSREEIHRANANDLAGFAMIRTENTNHLTV